MVPLIQVELIYTINILKVQIYASKLLFLVEAENNNDKSDRNFFYGIVDKYQQPNILSLGICTL